MTKQEYLSDLANRLKGLPKEDRDDAILYYEELIGDMELTDGEDVSLRIGTPKEVAREIIQNSTVKYAEEISENPKNVKSTGKVIWLSILGILSAPVALPLAIVLFAVALVLVITLLVIYISFFATAIALVVGGFISVVTSFMAPGFMNKITSLGMGLLGLSLGILFGWGLVLLVRVIIKGIGRKKSKKGNLNYE